jgi:hypothetical protein
MQRERFTELKTRGAMTGKTARASRAQFNNKIIVSLLLYGSEVRETRRAQVTFNQRKLNLRDK